jgi:peptide/nickel transport system permease protein
MQDRGAPATPEQIELAESLETVSRLSRVTGNTWTQFIVRRLVNLLIVLAVLVFCDFLILRLIPGDPAEIMAGVTGAQDQVQLIRHELGLDLPLQGQMVNYALNLAHGNLGHSFQTNEPVTEIISQRIGSSVQLAGTALVLVLLLGIPIGMLLGALTREERHRRLELAFTSSTSVVGALPEYFVATLLAFIFGLELRLLPVAGGSDLSALVLPAAAIVIRPIAVLARVVRVETLNVLAQDYIRTARSKRLPARIIYLRHVLPNVVTAALTISGILFAQLVGGAIVIENVFARNGLGTTLVIAVVNRDYPVIQGVILVLGVIVVVVNAVIDAVIALLDPRSRARLA